MNNNYKKIIISAPAKINLYLEVLDKLDNGYHNINSVMQSVDLADTLVISVRDVISTAPIINLVCNNMNIPLGKSNLAYVAAEKFCRKYGIENKQIYIYIDKKIPVSAGLAGGSTDAAAVLIGLNILLDLNVSKDELCELGVTIGADVPFCIKKGAMIAQGIGDVLTPCPSIPDCNILILINNASVSTKAAFEMYDVANLPKDLEVRERLITAIRERNLLGICNNLYNTFENVITEVDKTIKSISKFHPVGVLMSGSGPAVYAIFDSSDEMYSSAAMSLLSRQGYRTFMCKPCGSQEYYIIENNL